MNSCIAEDIQQVKLGKLKEKVLVHDRTNWDEIIALVKSAVGAWANSYNQLRSSQLVAEFKISKDKQDEHLQIIEETILIGCDLLLLVHYVEDKSDPKRDLSEINSDLTNALRALKLSRSAFSHPVDEREFASFLPSEC
ncbi:MAG: hypothetical protein V4689_13555 [Verrucomicrobiota bacterium]